MSEQAAGLQSLVIDTRQHTWTNKHQTYTQKLLGIYDIWNPTGEGSPLERYNATTRGLQELIADAVMDRIHLRALGGGWSLSGAPATDGRLVNTKPLNLYFRLTPEMVHAQYTGDAAGLHFVQCGCTIVELNARFRRLGRSLKTSGASNGQTIAGALSTGTHGSAIDTGAIHDTVAGLHLLVGPQRHIWLERASRPVTSDGFARRLGAELVRDDALFDAALVSFGSFGIIHGVLMETEPLFLLKMYRQRLPLDRALRRALDTLDFSGLALPGGAERPYHFQVVVNPFAPTHSAHVITLYRRPFRPGYARPGIDLDGMGPGDDAAAFIGLVTDLAPPAIPFAVNQVLSRAYRDIYGVEGTLGEIFTNTTIRGRVASTAMGLPISRATEALDLVQDFNRESGPFPVLIAFRYVKQTQATLGWTRFEPTCVLELDGPLSDRTLSLYRRVWAALRERGIPHTFHWGKQLELGAEAVREMYGDAIDRWLAARNTLLDAESRRVFSNRFQEELGLAAP
ncbi:FAD-binding protein [Stigmatella hybrida]|uniref:FAD-binding protein n=1 Tax=Stigmatella hybrida TaxID=394097 RepID=UPI001CDADBF2|nr:FAD-binding protein [Stigmatella hybrida]